MYVADRDDRVLIASALFGFPASLAGQLDRMEFDEARASTRSYLKNEVVTHDSPDLPSGIAERVKAADATNDRWVSLPIRVRGQVVGSFGLIFRGSRAFLADEITLYQSLADQLGVGLDKAWVYEAERQGAGGSDAHELETTTLLLQAASTLAQSDDLRVGLDRLVAKLRNAIPGTRTSCMVLSRRGSDITVLATGGGPAPPVGAILPLSGMTTADERSSARVTRPPSTSTRCPQTNAASVSALACTCYWRCPRSIRTGS